MCGAYSAGDQGEATTYYQLPPPPSLQPCTWIGPPAPPPSLPLAISFLLFRFAVGESQSWSIKVPIPTSDPEINELRKICIHSPTWLSSCSYCILGVSKKEWNCLKINLPGCHPNNAMCRHDRRTRDPKLRRWCCQGPPPGVVAPQMEFIRCQRGSRVKRVGPKKPVVTFRCVRNSSQIQTPERAMDQVTFIFLFSCICNPGPSKLCLTPVTQLVWKLKMEQLRKL